MALLLKSGPERILQKEYVILQPNISEEEFWDYANEDADCELIQGVLYIHSPASEEHEDIFSYLMTFFRLYLGKSQLGKIYGSRFVMRLSKQWNPESDLLIILKDHYARIHENKIEGPADLIIEILSPSTREVDLDKKLPKYLEVGVAEVWVIDPASRILSIHHPNVPPLHLSSDSSHPITSTVLGVLPLQPKWIWNREKYPIHKIFTL